jgi:hypothetical protein
MCQSNPFLCHTNTLKYDWEKKKDEVNNNNDR